MNKRIGILLTVVLLLVVSSITISWLRHRDEIRIRNLVNDNAEFLNGCIENKSYDRIYEIKGIKKITKLSLDKDEIFVDFFCNVEGIAPSVVYYGFYYTSEDKPSAFPNGSGRLERNKNSWKWKQDNGDNYYITKRIKDNWYYYEAGF